MFDGFKDISKKLTYIFEPQILFVFWEFIEVLIDMLHLLKLLLLFGFLFANAAHAEVFVFLFLPAKVR